jgi:hypothetical protein
MNAHSKTEQNEPLSSIVGGQEGGFGRWVAIFTHDCQDFCFYVSWIEQTYGQHAHIT